MIEKKFPPDTLTVIIRDDAPLLCAGDSPSYRSVRVKLTQEQREALMLHSNGTSGRSPIWEEISHAIIENIKDGNND